MVSAMPQASASGAHLGAVPAAPEPAINTSKASLAHLAVMTLPALPMYGSSMFLSAVSTSIGWNLTSRASIQLAAPVGAASVP
jgi:hypothetical protein